MKGVGGGNNFLFEVIMFLVYYLTYCKNNSYHYIALQWLTLLRYFSSEFILCIFTGFYYEKKVPFLW